MKDVFGLWQVKNAEFSGKYQIPVIHGTSKIPESLVAFTDCEKEKNPENKAIHFYQNDEVFVSCLQSESKLTKKLETFKKFQSVICVDNSVFRDMPIAMQISQVYKNHSFANFLMQNGINVIPNVRWGDERSYDFAFEGLDKWGVVAVGALGGYGDKDNTEYFEKGFYKMLEVVEPEIILCYGNLSEGLLSECNLRNINIKQYPTKISTINRKADSTQQELFF